MYLFLIKSDFYFIHLVLWWFHKRGRGPDPSTLDPRVQFIWNKQKTSIQIPSLLKSGGSWPSRKLPVATLTLSSVCKCWPLSSFVYLEEGTVIGLEQIRRIGQLLGVAQRQKLLIFFRSVDIHFHMTPNTNTANIIYFKLSASPLYMGNCICMYQELYNSSASS